MDKKYNGSCTKVKDKKRSKPWRARVQIGIVYNPKNDSYTRKYKNLGMFKTKAEGLKAIAEYNTKTHLDDEDITFKELYLRWSDSYFKDLNARSSIRTIESAYNYCGSIYNKKMSDIKIYDLKELISSASKIDKDGNIKCATSCVKYRIKSMLNLIYDYAVEYEICQINYARNFKLEKSIKKEAVTVAKEINIFSDEQIKELWKDINYPFTDMILIGIYSGWRPSELSLLKVKDIDIKNNTMLGGLKTDAGKNRYVPIHPAIKPLIEKRLKEAKSLKSEYLFNDPNDTDNLYMTYDKYHGRFIKVMKRHGWEYHSPHECRHTFITLGKRYGMNDNIIKLIVGHSINDLTERVYTHRTMDQLQEEILKIKGVV